MSMTKEEVVTLVRKVASEEQLKLDGTFLCGFPTGLPNEELRKATKAYIDLVDAGQDTAAAAKTLITALEGALAREYDVEEKDDIVRNTDKVQALLDNKDML